MRKPHIRVKGLLGREWYWLLPRRVYVLLVLAGVILSKGGQLLLRGGWQLLGGYLLLGRGRLLLRVGRLLQSTHTGEPELVDRERGIIVGVVERPRRGQ